MSNDQRAYNSYCDYCQTVSVTPMAYYGWLKVTADAEDEF